MLWAILAILVALIWSAVNIIDKFTVTKLVRNPLTPLIYSGVVGIIVSAFIVVFVGIDSISMTNKIVALFAGVLYMLTSVFYFKALNIEEASRVNPLFFVSSLFVLVLAALFLGEKLSLSNYVGVLLLVSGAILISVKKFSLSLGKAFW